MINKGRTFVNMLMCARQFRYRQMPTGQSLCCLEAISHIRSFKSYPAGYGSKCGIVKCWLIADIYRVSGHLYIYIYAYVYIYSRITLTSLSLYIYICVCSSIKRKIQYISKYTLWHRFVGFNIATNLQSLSAVTWQGIIDLLTFEGVCVVAWNTLRKRHNAHFAVPQTTNEPLN